MGEVVKKDELIEIVSKLKKNGKKIVFTNGCFDILHVGHARYLKASKAKGDVLIVALNSDKSTKALKGESRPVNNENDRAELLSELAFVDYVIIFDESSPSKLLEEIKPTIYTKGADYTMDNLPEAPVVLKNNIEVKFIELVKGKSTTNIINKINN